MTIDGMTLDEVSFILANIDRREFDNETNKALDIAIKSIEAWKKIDYDNSYSHCEHRIGYLSFPFSEL